MATGDDLCAALEFERANANGLDTDVDFYVDRIGLCTNIDWIAALNNNVFTIKNIYNFFHTINHPEWFMPLIISIHESNFYWDAQLNACNPNWNPQVLGELTVYTFNTQSGYDFYEDCLRKIVLWSGALRVGEPDRPGIPTNPFDANKVALYLCGVIEVLHDLDDNLLTNAVITQLRDRMFHEAPAWTANFIAEVIDQCSSGATWGLLDDPNDPDQILLLQALVPFGLKADVRNAIIQITNDPNNEYVGLIDRYIE